MRCKAHYLDISHLKSKLESHLKSNLESQLNSHLKSHSESYGIIYLLFGYAVFERSCKALCAYMWSVTPDLGLLVNPSGKHKSPESKRTR